jgi:lipoate-protein ligase B
VSSRILHDAIDLGVSPAYLLLRARMMREEIVQHYAGPECRYKELGLIEVPAAEQLMIAAGESRFKNEIPDLLLFMAHPRTVALGLRDRLVETPKDLLVSRRRLEREGIALTRSVRGGGITYHWPGQVVCYPILALSKDEQDIPGYMRKLEEVGIVTLKAFGVDAVRRRDSAAHVGLWIDNTKVMSMGVRVSRWVTSFGFAINLEGDAGPSRYLHPCGLRDVRLTTLEEILGTAPPRAVLIDAVRESFASVFGRVPDEMPDTLFDRISPPLAVLD